ncbi:MAG: thiol-disulfide isomerase/thioredoxin [Roseivirga sp.]|jgi:thiol-disulfide isomerase/thioredoxin
MKTKIIHLFALSLILLACKHQEPQEVLKPEKPRTNQIVLIFENPVINGFYTIPNSGGRWQYRTKSGDEIQYIDDQFIPRRASFNLSNERDTVVIATEREFLEVQLMYKGVDDLRYIFKNGDTVEIRHEDIKPIAKIKNRIEDYAVTNFSLLVRDSISEDDYRALEIIDKPLTISHRFKSSGIEEIQRVWREINTTASENLVEEIKQELSLLDSLYNNNKMSKEQFNAHIASTYYELKLSSSRQKKDEKNLASSTINQIMKNIESLYPIITNNREDSLLYLMDYNKAITASIAAAYNKKVGRVKRESKSAGVNIINYTRLYDSIRVNSDLSRAQKKVIQYNNVNGILSNGTLFGIEDKLIYLTRFKNDFEDSVLISEIKQRYNLKFEIEDEIRLESINGQSSTLEVVLATNKGKVIYIDFWASWCAPCIKEMPSSKSFSSNYAEDDIVFIYVSTDRSNKDWKQSIEKNNLNTGQHYRVTNANNSKGFEDLNIPFIPRYMIYNKEGYLVNDDAPRPSQTQLLNDVLAKYLTQEN